MIKTLPENGLALFSGLCEDQNGKEDFLTVAVEPMKALTRGFYRCDNHFHFEILQEQMVDDHARFGFIILDGSDASFYVLAGKNRETLFEWSKVNLPKKHGRGGQSQNRFARIRDEKRDLYLNKVAELVTQHFITNDMPNVQGLILAGCADMKTELSTKLDPRLKAVVLAIIDVQYNGVPGFNECIEKCSNILKDSEYIQERALLAKFFESVKMDEPVVYGIQETMKALLDSGGAVEKVLVAEKLPAFRAVLAPVRSSDGDEMIFFGSEAEVNTKANEGGFKVLSTEPLVHWLLENSKTYGAEVEVISDTSPISSQFTEGFGGLGAMLRYLWVPDFDEKGAEEHEDGSDYVW